jgi:hypothetical protein
MGFSPQQVGAMSLWQFLAARAGYILANSTEDAPRDLTPAEFDRLGDWLDEPPVWN